MKNKDEALKMAATLKAIGGYFDEAALEHISLQEVAEMLEALVAQPAQEPVAWYNPNREWHHGFMTNEERGTDKELNAIYPIPLYTHPAPAQEYLWDGQLDNAIIISKKKEWQGLSDDERDKIYFKTFDMWSSQVDIDYAEAIEQALKEKNHG